MLLCIIHHLVDEERLLAFQPVNGFIDLLLPIVYNLFGRQQITELMRKIFLNEIKAIQAAGYLSMIGGY